jgi:very-short-patch-repair endonuclease
VGEGGQGDEVKTKNEKQSMKPSTGLTRLQRVSEKKLRTARALRKEMTPAEKALWDQVRDRRCGGYKFRRQQIVEGFFADFYCERVKLAVEIDGSVHENAEQKKNDRLKERVFQARGIKTIRFGNEGVLGSLRAMLDKIIAECNQRTGF